MCVMLHLTVKEYSVWQNFKFFCTLKCLLLHFNESAVIWLECTVYFFSMKECDCSVQKQFNVILSTRIVREYSGFIVKKNLKQQIDFFEFCLLSTAT